MSLEGKKVLVFGSGISGIGAADLLTAVGACPVIYDGNDRLSKEDIRSKLKDGKDVPLTPRSATLRTPFS